MKKSIFILFCFCSSICFSQLTPTSVKKRAEQKAENRANQKVDQTIDKGLDAIEGLFKKKKKKAPQTQNENTSAPSVEYPARESNKTSRNEDFVPSQYEFIGTVVMEYRFYKNDKEEKHSPLVVEMHLSKVATAVKMLSDKNPTSVIIMHLDQNKMTMLTDIEKKGMAIEMKQPNLSKYEEMEVDVEKTGNTRNINDYQCQEFIITTDGHKTSTWTTKEISFDYSSFQNSMLALSKMNPQGKTNYYGDLEGFPIEMVSLSDNGKEKIVITTKEFTEGSYDASLFDTSGYDIMKMPSFGN